MAYAVWLCRQAQGEVAVEMLRLQCLFIRACKPRKWTGSQIPGPFPAIRSNVSLSEAQALEKRRLQQPFPRTIALGPELSFSVVLSLAEPIASAAYIATQ